jgi:hypothetical protein
LVGCGDIGAAQTDIIGTVFGQAMRPIVIDLAFAVRLGLAFFSMQAVSRALAFVSPRDPISRPPCCG